MRVYRARCRLAMSALLIEESDYSLLPTLTVHGNYNRKGSSPNCGDGLRTALLPTLSASNYGWNKGGAAGREGPARPSLETIAKRGMLPTLLASHPEALRDRRGMKHQSMLPTLTRRDEKGPGPANKHRGGKDLPGTLGGHLSPDWCAAFMGFPPGWLDLDDSL